MTTPENAPKRSGVQTRWLRAWGRAMRDEATYDLRRNPSLWLGFLLALPIPISTYAAGAALWLKLLTLLAPLAWAILLGAAGQVSLHLAKERDSLEDKVADAVADVARVRTDLDKTSVALDEQRDLRARLEQAREDVMEELRLAQAVQRTLASPDIHHERCEAVIHSLPSQYIGGDYVHAQVVEDRWLYVIVADVSGHGIAAALVVARIHGLIRRLTLTKKKPVGVLERLNRSAVAIFGDTYFFMTVAVCRIDLHTGRLQYATAGHPAQLLLRREGGVELLRTRNRLLGMDLDIFDKAAPSGSYQLEPGDTLVMFTDGLFEILEDGAGEVLGEDGLHQRVSELRHLPLRLMVGETLQEIAKFQGHSSFEDDVTLVAARWNGPAPDGT